MRLAAQLTRLSGKVCFGNSSTIPCITTGGSTWRFYLLHPQV